jgi:sphingolipid delta-4 desaturase
VAPAAIEFRHQHLLHHRFLGDADGKDTQAPTRAEARFVGTSTLRKFSSFTFGRFFFRSRPANKVPFDRWLALNWSVQIAATGALFHFEGPRAIAYLLISALLAFGPHPVGARRISEHLPVIVGQPTNSYYGALNWVSFNVGYHVEHHDFPAVAWTRLPRLHEIAREDYAALFHVRSWMALLVSYMTSRRIRVDHYIGMGLSLEEEAIREKQGPPRAAHFSRWNLPRAQATTRQRGTSRFAGTASTVVVRSWSRTRSRIPASRTIRS